MVLRTLCLLLTLAALSAGTLGAQVIRKRVPASSFETITLVYTANLGGRPASRQTDAPASAVKTVIQGLRKEYGDLLLLDLGNFLGPTPTTILTQGALDFAVMERLGYDLLHLSSNEFVVGSTALKARIAETVVPVVSGNLVLAGSRAAPWTILRCGNRRIGFLGVTSSDFENLVMATMRRETAVSPADASIKKAIAEMAGKADIVVALTDLSEIELALIRTIPGLDVILTTGGNAAKSGADWISVGFPGTKRAAIARVLSPDTAVHVLEIHGYADENKWTVDEVVGAVYVVDENTPREPSTELWIQAQVDPLVLSTDRTKGRLGESISHEDGRSVQTPWGTVVTDWMRHKTRAHLALVDSGALRNGLPLGPVTDWDLIEALPFPDQVVVAELTGTQIEAVILRSLHKVGEDGFLQYSNLVTKPTRLGDRIGGQKILLDRTYWVAMPEFLAEGGDGYEELKGVPIVQRTGQSLAEMIGEALATHGDLLVPGLPLEDEARFWFSRLHLGFAVNGFVADSEIGRLYPDQVALRGAQLLSTAFETRFSLNRSDVLSEFTLLVEAQYGVSWGENWVPLQTLDKVRAGAEYTLLLSNLFFAGERIVDPYASAVLETALVFPDPTRVTLPLTPRPGTLKLVLGLEATTLLRPLSLKVGLRRDNHPFRPENTAVTGVEAIVSCQADLVEDVLSFDTTTEVFSSLDPPVLGVSVSSVNQVSLSWMDYIKIGPRIQLYYSSQVGHLAYLFDVSVILNWTLG